ncbi:MAG TPA: sensor histidine kinase N-terminal domain-containing protein [Xanthobacteraceae bacterium]|nr:sensor histidine kinase N-terminal domain-containing protein [Xanthobacteraceae bacterium]
MIGGWLQSLQVRLALRVAALYIAAAVVVIVVLMSRAYDTARSLGDQELLLRANDLAGYVTAGENGLPRLELPANLSAMYQLPSGRDIFAVRDATGRMIAAAPPRFGELVASWPKTTSEPVRFDVRLDTEPGDFDGLSISRETVTGLVSVSVGRPSAGAVAVYSLMRKFIHDTIWAVSILVLAAWLSEFSVFAAASNRSATSPRWRLRSRHTQCRCAFLTKAFPARSCLS